MQASPTVHVVDDDGAMRRSLSVLLDAAGYRVEEHPDAESLLGALDRIEAGCVLADVRMPGVDGIEMLGLIRASGSTVRVVVMTGHGDVATAVRAMRLGAWDFLEKPFPAPLLLQSVGTAILRGPVSDDVEVLARAFAEQVSHLSPRERDVFERVLLGRTNKEIAGELDISPRTVETYRAKLMTKTGCDCVQSLVRMAVLTGLA